MTNTELFFTLSDYVFILSERLLLIGLLITGILVATLLVLNLLPPPPTPKGERYKVMRRLAKSLGIQSPTDEQLMISLWAVWIFGPLFLLALFATFVLLIATLRGIAGVEQSVSGSLGLGALLVALLGTPFLVWRTAVAQSTARTQERALFNEKINAATNDLHAMRQVSKPAGKFKWESVWEPDIVRRNAAIDALFGLAQERPEETGRIARMLSVYVRELSDTEAKAVEPPKDASTEKLREWARGLKLQRSDMQAAVQTLGKLRTEVPNPTLKDADIDLSRANLQAMDLAGLCFDKAKLTGAQMQGAYLREARMQGAYLGGARMQGANLGVARMQGAYLGGARMQGAYLGWAQMQGAYLGGARMQGAYLGWAEFDAESDFTAAVVQYAAVKSGSFEHVNVTQDQINTLFGDAGTPVPDGLTRPDHWPDADLDMPEFGEAWRIWRAAQPGWDPAWA